MPWEALYNLLPKLQLADKFIGDSLHNTEDSDGIVVDVCSSHNPVAIDACSA